MRRLIWPVIAGLIALWLVLGTDERPQSTPGPDALPTERPVALTALPGGGFAVGGQGGGVAILDPDGAVRARWVAHGGPVRRIVALDGVIATAGDGSVARWKLNGARVGRRLRLAEHTLNDVALADGAVVVAADRGSVARLDGDGWHARGSHGRATFAVAASPDGARFASGGADGSLAIWSADGAEQARWRPTEGWITALAWTGAGLIAADSDGRVAVWAVPAPGDAPPSGPSWQVKLAADAIVALAARGATALAGTEGGRAFVVDLDRRVVTPVSFELPPEVEPAPLSAVALSPTRALLAPADRVLRRVALADGAVEAGPALTAP